jgi:hypothetical protein
VIGRQLIGERKAKTKNKTKNKTKKKKKTSVYSGQYQKSADES